MKRVTFPLVLIFLSITFCSYAQQQTLTVTITQPQADATVEQRDTVAGSVSDPKAQVWVVIHPIGTNTFWVQPPVTLNPDGTWSVRTYFGREGMLDSDNQYEVRAFANPREPLQADERPNWPLAAAQSQDVTVTRK